MTADTKKETWQDREKCECVDTKLTDTLAVAELVSHAAGTGLSAKRAAGQAQLFTAPVVHRAAVIDGT